MSQTRYLAVLAVARRIIEQHGWTVICSSTGAYEFAYTAGLTEQGQPELIITGLPGTHTQMILNAAVLRILADTRAGIGSTYELPNDSTILPTFNVQLAPVADRQLPAHLRVALTLYGRDQVHARQLLYADFNRLMPTHPAYDHAALHQPLLDQ